MAHDTDPKDAQAESALGSDTRCKIEAALADYERAIKIDRRPAARRHARRALNRAILATAKTDSIEAVIQALTPPEDPAGTLRDSEGKVVGGS